jgi:hypothetical protein
MRQDDFVARHSPLASRQVAGYKRRADPAFPSRLFSSIESKDAIAQALLSVPTSTPLPTIRGERIL